MIPGASAGPRDALAPRPGLCVGVARRYALLAWPASDCNLPDRVERKFAAIAAANVARIADDLHAP